MFGEMSHGVGLLSPGRCAWSWWNLAPATACRVGPHTPASVRGASAGSTSAALAGVSGMAPKNCTSSASGSGAERWLPVVASLSMRRLSPNGAGLRLSVGVARLRVLLESHGESTHSVTCQGSNQKGTGEYSPVQSKHTVNASATVQASAIPEQARRRAQRPRGPQDAKAAMAPKRWANAAERAAKAAERAEKREKLGAEWLAMAPKRAAMARDKAAKAEAKAARVAIQEARRQCKQWEVNLEKRKMMEKVVKQKKTEQEKKQKAIKEKKKEQTQT